MINGNNSRFVEIYQSEKGLNHLKYDMQTQKIAKYKSIITSYIQTINLYDH